MANESQHSNKSSKIETIVKGAQIISTFLALFALIFLAYQTKQNTKIFRQTSYLPWLRMYMELNDDMKEEEIAIIYSSTIQPKNLTTMQENHIYKQISFCEGLYLTNQINVFPDIKGGSWQNHIRDIFTKPTIYLLWKESEAESSETAFAEQFAYYINTLIKDDVTKLENTRTNNTIIKNCPKDD